MSCLECVVFLVFEFGLVRVTNIAGVGFSDFTLFGNLHVGMCSVGRNVMPLEGCTEVSSKILLSSCELKF